MPSKKLNRIKTRHFQLRKGLTRAQAITRMLRRSGGDSRAATYNPKTGKGTLT